jgi:hypothetical protein
MLLGTMTTEDFASMNADMRFLYLLYCLSCAMGVGSDFASESANPV